MCCISCAASLETFHIFYESIRLKIGDEDENVFIKCEALETEPSIIVKTQHEELSHESSSDGEIETKQDKTSNLKRISTIASEPKKRGRPKKETFDSIKPAKKEHQSQILPKKVYRRRTKLDDSKIINSIDMKCDLCDVLLESFADAVLHHQNYHNQKGYLICCSRKFRQKSALIDHLDFHENPEHFQCQTCNRNFNSLSNLRTHITTSHLPQTRFQCDSCGKYFNCKYRLASHLKIHISQKESSVKFPCLEKDCGKVFHNKMGLKSHHKICHNPNRDTFSCEICGKQLMTRTSLKDHVENTHAEKIVKIECHLCGHFIKNEYSMKKHLNRHKQMTEDISCEICGKKCTTKAALRSHLRMKHLLQRNFKCSFCEKCFKQAIDQKEHEATHTGVDLYSCLWCTATFKFGANFRAHRKSAHPEEYEKIKPAWLRPN